MNSPSRVTTATQNLTHVLQRGFTSETLSPFGFTVVRAMQFSFFVGSQLTNLMMKYLENITQMMLQLYFHLFLVLVELGSM